jgi:hypothetical protein
MEVLQEFTTLPERLFGQSLAGALWETSWRVVALSGPSSFSFVSDASTHHPTHFPSTNYALIFF